jgi:hypothetical protein
MYIYIYICVWMYMHTYFICCEDMQGHIYVKITQCSSETTR